MLEGAFSVSLPPSSSRQLASVSAGLAPTAAAMPALTGEELRAALNQVENQTTKEAWRAAILREARRLELVPRLALPQPPDIDEHLCWNSDGGSVPCTPQLLKRKLDCMKVSEALKFIACVLEIPFVGHRWTLQEVQFLELHWTRKFADESWLRNVPRESFRQSPALRSTYMVETMKEEAVKIFYRGWGSIWPFCIMCGTEVEDVCALCGAPLCRWCLRDRILLCGTGLCSGPQKPPQRISADKVKDGGLPIEWEPDVGVYGCHPSGFHDALSDSSDESPDMET